ncbi:uncharacterized protein LY79DRAFT_533769 [Colletotrichum navitas]|uniref:Uncharacterized protein n=1 Tax=Colletotrichum navitas TaxID=681940 RepID=A0AAD8QD87_9PEZI|nr:uncharacterized protein LY79DRAFT_533769 [Colletotrichum navitas]KAK1600487.1 hypothetical protein LY79DRAFT_533769 [Colletotrichum navitas]
MAWSPEGPLDRLVPPFISPSQSWMKSTPQALIAHIVKQVDSRSLGKPQKYRIVMTHEQEQGPWKRKSLKKSEKDWKRQSLTGIEPDVGVEPTTLRLRVSRSTD